MNRNDWVTIPVLPCRAIGETLTFWENMGFQITYRQDRPYQCGVIRRNGHDLHFIRVKEGALSTTSLILVQDVGKVHEEFCKRLKTQFGKIPLTGIPRISRMRPGQSRFTLTDVSGNSVIWIQIGEKDPGDEEKADGETATPLQKTLMQARRLRDFKEDHVAAAKVLDSSLKKLDQEESERDRAEALIMRGELARVLGEEEKVAECALALSKLGLEQTELQQLREKHCWTT